MEKKAFFSFSVEDVNLILVGLNELPRKHVNKLCSYIEVESNKQLSEYEDFKEKREESSLDE